jgi:hypothetical protein
LQGQSLQVLGWTHRDGTLNLTLVLPDGSRSFIPADWTDFNKCNNTPTNRRPAPNVIATTSHLLHVRKVVDALLCKLNSSKHESKKVSKEGRKYAKANATLGAPQESPQCQQIWRNLQHQLQKDVITALSNLICKMVLSQDVNRSQEESHER